MPRSRSAIVRIVLPTVAVAVGMTTVFGVAPARALAIDGSTGTSAGAARPVAAVGPGWRKEMVGRINAVRAAAGVTPLKPCPALRRSAQEYAALMSTRDHFGHVGPDGSQPAERMRREGYRWRVVAENIAAGQRTVEDVMAAWVGSAGHYANLVDPTFRHVGLGYRSSGAGEYGSYWVQNLGRGRGC